jgi:hypothetical protein
MGYRRGQAVIYEGERYYITRGPIMGTEGAIYEISKVPPPIQGVLESELQPARDEKQGARTEN